MSLQYKFFMINAKDPEELEEELNSFLMSVRVVNVQREFVSQGFNSFWGIAVEYILNQSGTAGPRGGAKKKSNVDYREVLSEEDFATFVKLREWRKSVADKEALPVYTIFTNEQLAQIVQNRIMDEASLQKIPGVGDARVKKYSGEIIKLISSIMQNKKKEVKE